MVLSMFPPPLAGGAKNAAVLKGFYYSKNHLKTWYYLCFPRLRRGGSKKRRCFKRFLL
ncbi:MAG: hypothetical protein LBR79_01640 [Oscillospiraceae bacterium]|nr:hypothetical protein [Oscillospiraceae bacterium]